MCISLSMARYQWDPVKNDWLLTHRGMSFDQIVWHIAEGHVLDVLISDKEHYKGQKQFVVEVRGYAYLVPFVEQGDAIVLDDHPEPQADQAVPAERRSGRWRD